MGKTRLMALARMYKTPVVPQSDARMLVNPPETGLLLVDGDEASSELAVEPSFAPPRGGTMAATTLTFLFQVVDRIAVVVVVVAMLLILLVLAVVTGVTRGAQEEDGDGRWENP